MKEANYLYSCRHSGGGIFYAEANVYAAIFFTSQKKLVYVLTHYLLHLHGSRDT